MVDVETILAGLYAKEISASLAWKTHRGFQARFGYPAAAEKWFKTSGEAVRWLKEQALIRYPRAEFPVEPHQIGVDAEAILDDLYASGINGSIEWIWDGGFFASLGGRKKAEAWSLKTVSHLLAITVNNPTSVLENWSAARNSAEPHYPAKSLGCLAG